MTENNQIALIAAAWFIAFGIILIAVILLSAAFDKLEKDKLKEKIDKLECKNSRLERENQYYELKELENRINNINEKTKK